MRRSKPPPLRPGTPADFSTAFMAAEPCQREAAASCAMTHVRCPCMPHRLSWCRLAAWRGAWAGSRPLTHCLWPCSGVWERSRPPWLPTQHGRSSRLPGGSPKQAARAQPRPSSRRQQRQQQAGRRRLEARRAPEAVHVRGCQAGASSTRAHCLLASCWQRRQRGCWARNSRRHEPAAPFACCCCCGICKIVRLA